MPPMYFHGCHTRYKECNNIFFFKKNYLPWKSSFPELSFFEFFFQIFYFCSLMAEKNSLLFFFLADTSESPSSLGALVRLWSTKEQEIIPVLMSDVFLCELSADCNLIWMRTASSASDACAALKPMWDLSKPKLCLTALLFTTSLLFTSHLFYLCLVSPCFSYTAVLTVSLAFLCTCYTSLLFLCLLPPLFHLSSEAKFHLSLHLFQVSDFPALWWLPKGAA